jgi:anti-sigma B factor antagonist
MKALRAALMEGEAHEFVPARRRSFPLPGDGAVFVGHFGRATELLMFGLGQPLLHKTVNEDVTVIRFAGSTQLIGASHELAELKKTVQGSGDTKVLIDLSRVSRIDSAGLGMLMNCYTHAVRNSGMLKLLHPNPQVQKVLAMTRIDTVVDTFHDEDAAITSFQ